MAIDFRSSGVRVIVSRFLGVGLLAALLLSRTAWAQVAPVISLYLLSVGWVLLGIGVVGRIWCASYIIGKKTFSLIVDGPYSICRNPLYFFTLVGGAGAMFLTERLALVAFFILFFWMYFPPVMRREEWSLQSVHGELFHRYQLLVPRFWPNLHLFKEPEVVAISPRLFRRFLMEMMWFIWAGGLIELLQEMHEDGYLHAIVSLY
jgi:protein-S-isoprenylcysteine O-methyltransferase Ste14